MCPPPVAGTRVSPTTCPLGVVLRRQSNSCRRSHMAWQARFYWVVEIAHEPLAWRALGGYPVIDRSPFGCLLRIGSPNREPLETTLFNTGFLGVPHGSS